MRSMLQITGLDSSGNVRANKSVTITNLSGGALGQTLYDAASGGSVVTSPQTNSLGLLQLFVDNPADALVTVSGDSSASRNGFYPHASETVHLTAIQTLTNKTLTAPTVSDPTITGSGTFVGLAGTGALSTTGTFTAAPSGGVGGVKVQSTGRVGFLDATALDLDAQNIPFAVYRNNVNRPEVTSDFYLGVSYQGLAARNAANATGAGTTTSVVNTGVDYSTANLIDGGTVVGCIIEITGGAGYSSTDHFRYISSLTNSNHTLNWGIALSAPTDATTSYRIWRNGDVGTMRTRFEKLDGSVVAGRAAEFHAYAQQDAADAGLMCLELSVGSKVAQFDADRNNGVLSVRASAAWLTGGTGVEQGYGIRFWGSLGFRNYWTAENSGGTYEFYARKGGNLEMAGKLTVGTVTAGTAQATVKQAANTVADGLSVVESGSTKNVNVFMNGSGIGIIQSVNGAVGSQLQLQTNATLAAVSLVGDNTLTGKIASFLVNGVGEKASVDASGNVNVASGAGYRVNGTQVVGARMAAITALTISAGSADNTLADVGAAFSQATLNNNFADLGTKVNAILNVLATHGLAA